MKVMSLYMTLKFYVVVQRGQEVVFGVTYVCTFEIYFIVILFDMIVKSKERCTF